jgi:divalent metal cation (Fe/Co/Zn/Cd) transporter
VALWAGVGAGSIALVGVGLDSIIALAAAAGVVGRIAIEARGADSQRVTLAESRVRRFIGATFLALAAYVLIQSAWGLWAGDAPEESVVGLVLAVVSLVVMPLIAWGKLRAAEAKETLACSYLSLCLLLGLAANAAFGWWWADPLAALLMVPWLVREGLEGFEQDDD